MTNKSRQSRDEAVQKLYAAESDALERAEATLTRQHLSAAVYEPFRELAKHYRRLLRQTMKVTAISDATQLQLRRTSQELAEALQKVELLNAELRTLQQEKDEIFAMAVHDLRSPLSGISGLATLITDPEMSAPEEHRSMGGDILAMAESTLLLVNDLVDLYRFESGTLTFREETHALVTLRDVMHSTFGPLARKKHTQLTFKVPTPEATARVDAEFFLRVAGNLVSNAVKYSPAGTVVSVTLAVEQEHLRLSVQDQGPGISAADQKKLFRKFTRLSARPTGGETSSGLGLAIVKRITEAMQGRVWCESELGRGATFHVAVPANGDAPRPPA
ncbi:MAG TPA: HAMP domain-containing sensor histidine kinase [Opitutaceae bacterium]